MKFIEKPFDSIPHKNEYISFLGLMKVYCIIWFSNPLSILSPILGLLAFFFVGPLVAENFKFQYEPADVVLAAFQDANTLCEFDAGISAPLKSSGYNLNRTYDGKKLAHLSIETSMGYQQIWFDTVLSVKEISNEQLRYFDRLHKIEDLSCQHINLFPGLNLDNGRHL